jgi:hypothetical protein
MKVRQLREALDNIVDQEADVLLLLNVNADGVSVGHGDITDDVNAVLEVIPTEDKGFVCITNSPSISKNCDSEPAMEGEHTLISVRIPPPPPTAKFCLRSAAHSIAA